MTSSWPSSCFVACRPDGASGHQAGEMGKGQGKGRGKGKFGDVPASEEPPSNTLL